MNKRELSKFGKHIQKQLRGMIAFKRGRLDDADYGTLSGLKDSVYLLGISVDDKNYKWATGFEKFSKEIGIDWDVVYNVPLKREPATT